MARRRRILFSYESQEEPLINLTPLIDVVFVVLISFMLIAPLLDIDHVNLAENSSDKPKNLESIETSPLSIIVHEDNTIWFKNQKVSIYELKKLLREEKAKAPSIQPKLIHDKKAHFGTYQIVKGAVEDAGYEQMDVVLKP